MQSGCNSHLLSERKKTSMEMKKAMGRNADCSDFPFGKKHPKPSQPQVLQDVPQTPECAKPSLFCQVLGIYWVWPGLDVCSHPASMDGGLSTSCPPLLLHFLGISEAFEPQIPTACPPCPEPREYGLKLCAHFIFHG